jgi:hypothetical protein
MKQPLINGIAFEQLIGLTHEQFDLHSVQFIVHDLCTSYGWSNTYQFWWGKKINTSSWFEFKMQLDPITKTLRFFDIVASTLDELKTGIDYLTQMVDIVYCSS